MRPFPQLTHPIILAPLAGGPSTPELVATVSDAGGLGVLAAGYLSPQALGRQIDQTRALTSATFAVNLFCLTEADVDRSRLDRYARRLAAEAERYGVALGEPRFDDDGFEDKLALVLERRIEIVSFTFGCPPAAAIGRLHERGIAAWVTVTDVREAELAAAAGADALIAQGVEAGGHRGSFTDADGAGELSTLVLLRLIRAVTELPVVAAGGIADGAGVAAVLAAGATAAALGTAFLRSPEAGTAAAHREALARAGTTALTRAFTGRRARGIVNRFIREYDGGAPSAYPHIHYLTSPVRGAARQAGDGDAVNLWAGQAYPLAQELPAGELVRRLAADAADALESARRRLEDN